MKPINKALSDEYVGTTAGARILELSTQRVRQLTETGLLPSTQTPLGRLYPRRHLERIRALRDQFASYRSEDLRKYMEENFGGDDVT